MIGTEDVTELLAIKLIGIIPEDNNVIISTNRGTPIALENKSKAGQALVNISKRMMGEDVPFLDITVQSGFINQIGKLFSAGGS